MIRTPRLILVGLLLLSSTGCSGMFSRIFGPPRPALEQYRLTVRVGDTAAAPLAGTLPGTIAIAPYVTRGIYDGRGIAYRIDDVRLEAYPTREWAIPLRDMLGEATETILKARPLTTGTPTFDPRSPRSYDYQWRGTVREFEEVNRGLRVLAAVHLEAELVRNDSIVWSGSERIERAVPEPTDSMPRVVETLSILAVEAISNLIEQARAAVSAPTAAAAPPRR